MPSIAQLEALLLADPNDPFVLYGLAQEYAKQRDLSSALAMYDRCLQVDPHYCYAYFHKARALHEAGDESGALRTIDQGIGAARAASDHHALQELSGLRDELDAS
jgi:tetratricopeptide (TPR) repeat protein